MVLSHAFPTHSTAHRCPDQDAYDNRSDDEESADFHAKDDPGRAIVVEAMLGHVT